MAFTVDVEAWQQHSRPSCRRRFITLGISNSPSVCIVFMLLLDVANGYVVSHFSCGFDSASSNTQRHRIPAKGRCTMPSNTPRPSQSFFFPLRSVSLHRISSMLRTHGLESITFSAYGKFWLSIAPIHITDSHQGCWLQSSIRCTRFGGT